MVSPEFVSLSCTVLCVFSDRAVGLIVSLANHTERYAPRLDEPIAPIMGHYLTTWVVSSNTVSRLNWNLTQDNA